MQLAIQADDVSFVEDRRRVVELTTGKLGKTQNGRNGVAGKWSKSGAELTAFHLNCKIGRTSCVVRQTTEYGLRATEDFDSLHFTPINSSANEFNGLHRAGRQERGLVCSNLHKDSSSGKRSLCF